MGRGMRAITSPSSSPEPARLPSMAPQAARITSKSSMVSSHMRMLLSRVSSKMLMSWSTTEREPVNTGRGISVMGLPSKRMSPPQGLYKPAISLMMVDLPQPDGPTRATRRPGSMVRSKCSSRGLLWGE